MSGLNLGGHAPQATMTTATPANTTFPANWATPAATQNTPQNGAQNAANNIMGLWQ